MDDLQLAAQLGKQLLERNQMLELQLEQKLTIIEDNQLQIEYLQKQTAAQREVNESRLLIYDSLEVNIDDLETTNASLMLEKSNANRLIRSLSSANETLVSQVEECNRQLAEVKARCIELERKNVKLALENNAETTISIPETSAPNPIVANTAESSGKHLSNQIDSLADDELPQIIRDLNAQRRQCLEAQQRICELEEQLASLIQENQSLNKRIENPDTMVGPNNRSMHDELFGLLAEGRPSGWMTIPSRQDTELDDDMFSYDGTDGEDDEGVSTSEALSLLTDLQQKYEAVVPNAGTCSYADSVDSALGSTKSNKTMESSSSKSSETVSSSSTGRLSDVDAPETSVAATVGAQSSAYVMQNSQVEASIPTEAGLRMLPNKRDQQIQQCLSGSAKTQKKNRRKSRQIGELGAECINGFANQRDSLILPSPPRVFFASNCGGSRTKRDMRSATLGNAVAALSANQLQAGATTGKPVLKRSAAAKSLHQLIQLDVSYAEILRRSERASPKKR